MRPWELFQAPLRGMNLIEASAGTGKTHILTELYLRLLIELRLSPQQILVVTYTRAATAELKERIRRRLRQARQACGGGIEDATLARLLADQGDPAALAKRLELAIAGFDQAAIYTIHGFCQRVLTEHALESGQSLEVELVADQEAQLQEIAADFWRAELSALPDRLTDWVGREIGGPEQLLAGVRQGLGKPYLELRGAPPEGDLEALEAEAGARVEELRRLWSEEGETVCRYLASKAFRQNIYKPARVAAWCREMERWLAQEAPPADGFGELRRFTPAALRAGLRKGQELRALALFSGCERLLQVNQALAEGYRAAINRLREAFFHYLERDLARRQAAAGEWSYDELLLQLHRALTGPAGAVLGRRLQRRFPAALVDEFQDTDPLQYEIFQRIYGGGERPLFLVGDPKQAIYSFRGADLFAYLRARRAADAVYGLDVNWRSSPALIQALNTLFGARSAPFFYGEIPFQPVRPAATQLAGLQGRGVGRGALHIWRMEFTSKARLPEVRAAVARATAWEITRLLGESRAGRVQLDGRPLEGSDIAVLVRTHVQARRVAEALREAGVPAVRSAMGNLFETPEAEQLERLLLALLEPRHEARVRAALATDLLGWRGAELEALNHQGELANRELEAFLGYHRQWREQGFVRMFRRLLFEREVEPRLLAFRDGERRLTNLYQLLELLQRQDARNQPGLEGLLKWFSRQRQEPGAQEERQLRLESDSQLVKIVTQHACKGLQYPLVFCPYLWDEGVRLRPGQASYLYHDPARDYAPVFELGSPGWEQGGRHLLEEQLAENLRLLYVALTRARYHCYLPWGWGKWLGASALGWLLHAPEPPPGGDDDSLEAWRAEAKGLDAAQVEQRLQALAGQARGTITLEPLPGNGGPAQLPLAFPAQLAPARTFTGRPPPGLRINSFSSLLAGQSADLPDHDPPPPEDQPALPEPPDFTIHGFPRGPGPGSCLHAIFEEWDFCNGSRSELQRLVEEKLALFRLERRWTPVVVEMVEAVLATPLDAAGLRLAGIEGRRRVNEMEFHYPVGELRPGALAALVRDHRLADGPALAASLERLSFGQVAGFMKGFIDLVIEADGRFYLLDYKSNWLGPDRSAYHQRALGEAMRIHHYHLQYIFYCLALHRYLHQRLPDYDYERHFGGVFYLFLRGMGPDGGERDLGVYRQRLPRGFMEALDALIGVAR